ncbi:hypothetical protein FRC17_011017 [Serendipita sp. 399]|nr:hypothetical protein FRC17_011017 [Serendipita sp. 399]
MYMHDADLDLNYQKQKPKTVDLKSLLATKVVLDDGGSLTSAVTRNGHFHITISHFTRANDESSPHVPPGTYILQVLSPQHYFDQLRIDILPSSDLPEVRPYLPGTPLDPPATVTLPYPLLLIPRHHLQFFTPEESFDLMGMLRSPMVIMMAATGLLVFAVPYLMKNLDPDMLKEVQETQQKMAKLQDNMDLSSGLTNLLTGGTAAEAETSKSGVKAKKQSGKRR